MSDTPPAPPSVGRMIIELTPNGTSRPVPRVTFDPVGMFTPGLVYDSLPYFAQEVERAQAKVRYDAQHGPSRDAPDTPRETV